MTDDSMTNLGTARMRLTLPTWLLIACLSLDSAAAIDAQPPVGRYPRSIPGRVTAVPLQPPSAGKGSNSKTTALRLTPRKENGRQPLARPTLPNISSSLGTVLGGLGIVLGLFCVIAWSSRRFGSSARQVPKEAIEFLGPAPLSGKQQVQLLKVGNKLLLVVLSPAGAQTLTEITDPAEVEQLLALCRRGQPGSSSAAFREVLGQLASEPASGFAGPARTLARGAR